MLKSIKSHKEAAKEIGCDYLVHLAATFEIIESYLLHRPLELTNLNQNLSLIDGFFVPGLRLEVLCASLLMHDLDTIMIQKYLDEIYTLLDVCEGVKGRPTLIKTLYSTKPHLFSQQSKNNKVETWINNYVTPYIYAFDSVEEILFANLPDRPFIRPCDMTKCSGYCCYDGVYLRPDEEVLITNFIQNNKGTFPHEVTSYIIDGNWHDLVSGRKTSVKQYSYNTDFPAHFTQTKCIFSDKNGLCVLQLLCTEKLWHPWKIKPMSCWFFPLCTEDNRIIPPPKLGEEDRMHIDDTYPGYITCLHCGKEVQDGVSWKKLFKQELLYYYFLKEN